MAILNYTTQVDAEKTIGEIYKCLVKHGATKLVTDYDKVSKIPTSVTFCLEVNGILVAFCLPSKNDGVLASMKRDKVSWRFLNKEQANRVSWRIVKSWVEAQMAIVDAQLSDVAEVFLPYVVMKSGMTLYNHMKNDGMKLLQ